MTSHQLVKVVVADDEAPARRHIIALLRDIPDIAVVTQCRTGKQVIDAIRDYAPDLLFLDIQMPGVDGFGVIEEIGVAAMPAVIFVTAYDHYAVRAFEVHAIDYLLKPISQERFAAAVQRAKAALSSGNTEPRKRLSNLLRDWQYHSSAEAAPSPSRRPATIERLVVKEGSRVVAVQPDHIVWLEAADHYVYVHTKGNRYLVQEKLSVLEETLPPETFVRIHRSAIVNVTHVSDTTIDRFGQCYLQMSSGETLRISRRRRDTLKAILTK